MEVKNIKRGAALGITLVIIHKLLAMAGITDAEAIVPIFGVITMLFLMTGKIEGLFISGFIGLFTLLGAEAVLSITRISKAVFRAFCGISNVPNWLDIYVYGFCGSMLGLFAAIILTLTKFSVRPIDIGEIPEKRRAMINLYGIITAVSFGFMMLCDNAGIGVLIFAVLQLVMAAFLVDDKTRLLWFAPILVIAANPLVSASDIWLAPNIAVVLVLAGIIVSDAKGGAAEYLLCAVDRIYTACADISVSMRGKVVPQNRRGIIKRVMLALIITLPFAIALIYMLSKVDMVFFNIVKTFTLEWSVKAIIKILFSIAAALFLSALMCSIGFSHERAPRERREVKADLLIVNVFLTVIMAIYLLFAAVQFKYLFTGGELPYGLTYTQYARRGFFELLALTGVNILMILIIVRITRHAEGVWQYVVKALLCGLCAVTIVMLASSFYRMYLYSMDDGLTRLRLMVFGFLIFEALSLVVTFAYIIRPTFSITGVYLAAGLIYYCILNVTPTDRFVAKNQIDRYFAGDRSGVEYVMTLSADAAPEIERLIKDGEPYDSYKATQFLKNSYADSERGGIFSFSISERILEDICARNSISPESVS